MKRIKMTVQSEKTFEEGFEEYVLDMKARNLRGALCNHKTAWRFAGVTYFIAKAFSIFNIGIIINFQERLEVVNVSVYRAAFCLNAIGFQVCFYLIHICCLSF